jgi:hypothetical protein
MINPTTQAGAQFNNPYNILPDVLYNNPTVAALSQFTTPLTLGQFNTYNIVPDTVYTNPTVAGVLQFAQPLTLGQFDTFNYVTTNDIITPNTMLPSMQQFTQPLDLGGYNTFNYVTTNDIIPNPTVGASQFFPNTFIGPNLTFNYTTGNDFSTNPTVGVAQFTPTTVLGNETTFNYTTDNDFIPTNFNNVVGAGPDLAALSQSTANPTLLNNTFAPGAEQPGAFGFAPSQLGSSQDILTAFVSQFTPRPVPTTINVDPAVGINTNITPRSVVGNAIGYASSILGSLSGIPQIGQVGQTAAGMFDSTNSYLTLAKDRLTRQGIRQFIKYPDFRSTFTFPKGDLFNETNATFETSNQTIAYFTSRRVDGLAASTRFGMDKSWKSVVYAAAAVTPIGPYSVFNLDGFSNTGYGWGDHDNPDAFRNDFTLRSHVATRWDSTRGMPKVYNFTETDPTTGQLLPKSKLVPQGDWAPTLNPLELATPFRGDKVTVIDFGKRTLKDAYRWKPKRKIDLFDKQSLTQDFIKFYLTGPKLHNGLPKSDLGDDDPSADDIIVFRAHITNFDDSITANWTPVTMIGRADPNYTYTGMSRDVGLSFDVYATDRDEVKPIWRKLNALAGYTSPTYDPESIAMIAPWMRLTVGDLFVQAPVVLTSISYDFAMDAPWEINIEDDPTMMQVPLKIGVSLNFNMVGDYMPQKGGRFYTLAKRFDEIGTPKQGADNWLSDFRDNVATIYEAKEQETEKNKQTQRGKAKGL